ncbi:MAG TPA: hypothetical protein PKI11_08605, partial [Candidatus Hydrogenedentes bacterium]|nr:hypothetical protein [Candidatus Hydrogenedentota bacterium]
MTNTAIGSACQKVKIVQTSPTVSGVIWRGGMPPQDDPRWGGGLYELVLDGDDWDYRKIHSGNCHGLCVQDESIYVVDDLLGVVQLDRDYRVVSHHALPLNLRTHGLSWSSELEAWFVACSYADKVLVLDPDFRIQKELFVSHKHRRDGSPQHHCNDVFAVGSSA